MVVVGEGRGEEGYYNISTELVALAQNALNQNHYYHYYFYISINKSKRSAYVRNIRSALLYSRVSRKYH